MALDLEKLLGKKVRLIRGLLDEKEESGFRHYNVWIAGVVPVGAEGTVHLGGGRNPSGQYHIIWDDPAYAGDLNYTYAITSDTAIIEEV